MRSALLLVEPDPQAAGSIDLYLRARGHEVLHAAHPAAAVRKAAQRLPRAIVAAHIPDVIDAVDLVPRLRQLVPEAVIVVTALGPTPHSHFPGADAVVARPCHPQAIAEAIRQTRRARDSVAPAA